MAEPSPQTENSDDARKGSITVAIPTYKRAARLLECLESLANNGDTSIDVLVSINPPSPESAEVAKSFEKTHPFHSLTINTNTSNIGAEANVLRCIEMANTEWVWVLGDDDRAEPGAIESIRSEIFQHPDACAINFSTSLLRHWATREQTFATRGVEETIKKLDSFSNLLFISANVYRRATVIEHLSAGYKAIHAHCSQVAIVLDHLSHNPKRELIFSSSYICSCNPSQTESYWEYDDVNKKILRLFDCTAWLDDTNARKEFINKMDRGLGFYKRKALTPIIQRPLGERVGKYDELTRLTNLALYDNSHIAHASLVGLALSIKNPRESGLSKLFQLAVNRIKRRIIDRITH